MRFLRSGKVRIILIVCAVALIGLTALWYQAQRSRHDPARVLIACQGNSNKPLCYSDYIEGILRTDGIPAAFDALAIAYDSDPEFAGTCHAVTHDLGKVAYEEFSKSGKTELTSKASYCGYGFYHGFMDALYVDTNDMDEAREFCKYVGENVPHPPAPEFAEGSCYHGIGHGVTDGTDPRVWGDVLGILKPGLELCEKVSGGNTAWQTRCVSGVFNALGNMYMDPKFKISPGTNPYTLCRTGPFTDLERETCYDQMNTVASALAGDKLTGIVAFANTISDLHYRAVALHEAVSYYIQVLKLQQRSLDPQELRVCELPTSDLKEKCVSGFVGGIVEFGSPDQQYEEILRLCSADTFPGDLREICYTSLQTLSPYYFTKDVNLRICSRVPEQYRVATCRS